MILPAARALGPATSEKTASKAAGFNVSSRRGKNPNSHDFSCFSLRFPGKKGALQSKQWMDGMEIVIDVATQL